MDKIFVLSLHRSATRSAAMMLRAMGYRSLHQPWQLDGKSFDELVAGREGDLDFVWQTVRPLAEGYDALTDSPFPVLYPQLYETYPEARFVLMHRSPRNWIRSVRQATRNRALTPSEKVEYWHYLGDRPTSLKDVPENRLHAMLWRHLNDVTEFFSVRDPRRLAIIGIDEPGAGERLAMMLGYPALFTLPHVGQGPEDASQRSRYLDGMIGQSRRSLKAAEFAVSRAPGNPVFQRHLATLLQAVGRSEEAAAANARAGEVEARIKERRQQGAAATPRRSAAPQRQAPAHPRMTVTQSRKSQAAGAEATSEPGAAKPAAAAKPATGTKAKPKRRKVAAKKA